MNYLLGNLGKNYKSTTATIDIGGGSIQMACAISNEQFANAPKNVEGEPYVLQKHLMSKDYNLYVHRFVFSYLYFFHSIFDICYSNNSEFDINFIFA